MSDTARVTCAHLAPGTRRCLVLVTGFCVLGGATACGGGSQVVVRPPTSRVPATSSAPRTSAPVKIDPQVRAQPNSGLHDGESVTLTATGFGPDQSLVALQCADKGNNTGEGDCDVAHLVSLTTNAAGSGTARVTVRTHNVGSDHNICDRTHPCILSVSQATPNPTQSATVRINFR